MKIAVYCSAASDLPQKWIDGATAVGKWIGDHGAQLVYGGVAAGLMTAVAQAAKDAGAKIVGVVPVGRLDKASDLIDIKLTAPDLCERKSAMQLLADIFVILPGGCGTLDEFVSTFAHLNFTLHNKPIIVFNDDGLFSPVLEQLRLFTEKGLMKKECMRLLHVAHTIDELMQLLDETSKAI